MLEATNIYHGYDTETVFEGISLSVSPGEVTAIIGPSGVGKSTLLRLLSFFEPPKQGTVKYNDTDVWGVSEQQRLEFRRHIGMVFQEASLFDTSVRRNAQYGLRVRQSWTDRIRHEIANLIGQTNGTGAEIEALETVGLREKVDQDAASLSGGEAQRVAFARALAYDPEILLLDEPTSDLDPRNTALIEDAVLEARNRDIGVVVATHDMHQAERIADRVAVILGNEIIEVGETEDVFTDPTDSRTQKFIEGELIY